MARSWTSTLTAARAWARSSTLSVDGAIDQREVAISRHAEQAVPVACVSPSLTDATLAGGTLWTNHIRVGEVLTAWCSTSLRYQTHQPSCSSSHCATPAWPAASTSSRFLRSGSGRVSVTSVILNVWTRRVAAHGGQARAVCDPSLPRGDLDPLPATSTEGRHGLRC